MVWKSAVQRYALLCSSYPVPYPVLTSSRESVRPAETLATSTSPKFSRGICSMSINNSYIGARFFLVSGFPTRACPAPPACPPVPPVPPLKDDTSGKHPERGAWFPPPAGPGVGARKHGIRSCLALFLPALTRLPYPDPTTFSQFVGLGLAPSPDIWFYVHILSVGQSARADGGS
jgi:hypothetical protein